MRVPGPVKKKKKEELCWFRAGVLVKGRQSGQGPDAVEKEKLLIAVESSVKEKGEQKELWREEASSQLAFRSSFMNCRSAMREGTGCRLR